MRLIIGIPLLLSYIFINFFSDYGVVGYINNSEVFRMRGTGGAAYFGVPLFFAVLELSLICYFIKGEIIYNALYNILMPIVLMLLFGFYNINSYDVSRAYSSNFKIPITPIWKMYNK